MSDVVAVLSNSECQVEQGSVYPSDWHVVVKHPEWFTAPDIIETQDAESGEWRDETAAETEAADAAGTPVAPEAIPEPVGEQPEA